VPLEIGNDAKRKHTNKQDAEGERAPGRRLSSIVRYACDALAYRVSHSVVSEIGELNAPAASRGFPLGT
jgi:hypothetical protein